MTTSNQKKNELEQLKKLLVLLHINNYVVEEMESPDFIVNIGGENIGVEVTELYRDFANGNSAKTESDLPRIVEGAVKLYNKKGGIPYSFVISFNGEAAVARRNDVYKELGECLYQYSVNYLGDDNFANKEIAPDVNQFPSLTIVNSIHAQKINKTSVGIVVSSFSTVDVKRDLITSTIASKAEKLNEYRKQCKTIWLLVVLQRMALSGDFRLTDEYMNIESSGFDAVYVLDHYRDQIQCIRLPNTYEPPVSE